MDENREELFSALLPSIAARMRTLLANLHLASMALASPEERDRNPELDNRASRLDQSYYQLLQMATQMSMTGELMRDAPLKMQNIELVSLVEQICTEAEGPAGLLGLQLQFVCTMPMCICGVNRQAIESLLYQLLSNAFKFTAPGGSVTVELRRSGRQILLSVRDTGRGIDEAHLARLFDRYREETASEPMPHGLGLGLLICRRVAELHGGSIVAKSEIGTGTEFILALPDRKASGDRLSDVAMDYAGGFNLTLMELADALPSEAFLQRHSE